MTTELETLGIDKRAQDASKTTYQQIANEYNESHQNAISDGDSKGKGSSTSSGVNNVDRSKGNIIDRSSISVDDNTDFTGIGSAEDIAARRSLMTQYSDYNRNNEYDEGHPDAMSDGDARGKGTNYTHSTGYEMPHTVYGGYLQTIDTTDGGNKEDQNQRQKHVGRNLYGPTNYYDEASINVNTAITGQFTLN